MANIKTKRCKYLIVFCTFLLLNACSYPKKNTKLRTNSDSLINLTESTKNALLHLNSELFASAIINKNRLWSLNPQNKEVLQKYKKYPELRKKILNLHKYTIPLTAKIQEIQRQLINKAGGGISDKNHTLITPMRRVEVTQYMIQEKKAYELEKWLNDYVIFLNTKYKDFGIPKLPIIAQSNQRKALYMNDSTGQKKDFAHAYFENVPVIIAITYLQHFQNIVLRYEEEVIKYMILSLVDKK